MSDNETRADRLYCDMQANGRGDNQWIIDNIVREINTRKILPANPRRPFTDRFSLFRGRCWLVPATTKGKS